MQPRPAPQLDPSWGRNSRNGQSGKQQRHPRVRGPSHALPPSQPTPRAPAARNSVWGRNRGEGGARGAFRSRGPPFAADAVGSAGRPARSPRSPLPGGEGARPERVRGWRRRAGPGSGGGRGARSSHGRRLCARRAGPGRPPLARAAEPPLTRPARRRPPPPAARALPAPARPPPRCLPACPAGGGPRPSRCPSPAPG